MESKKINQLATELAPDLSDLTIIGDPTTGISKKITLSQMASLFTGTVEEYANLAAFPLVGVADTIYVALDTNIIYRYDTSLSAYVILSPNIINSLVFSDANGFDGTITLVGSVATLSITTALTLGSVPFIGASGALTQDNANLFFDDTNNRLGIATALPTTPLDVFGSGIIGRLNATSTNNSFLGFASNGTNKWSAGNVQSDHRFRIFSEANSAELITILQTGEFGIGIANPTTKFHIDGAASALIANLDANISIAKSVSYRSDNSARINLEVSGTESGSNAGADFFLRTFTDAGSLLETPFSIVRSTGVTTIKSLTLTNALSVANGGTGSTTQNFVDLTTTQSIGGLKTFTDALNGTSATFSGFLGVNGSPGTSFPFETYINSSTAYSSTSRGNIMRVYNSNTSANIFAGIELGGAGAANDGLAGINAVVTGSGSAALTFYTRDNGTFGEKVRITSGGNVLVGTTTDNGGRICATGLNSSSANDSIYLENAALTVCFRVRNDGVIFTGTAARSPVNDLSGAAANLIVAAGGNLQKSTASSIRFKENVNDWIGDGLNTILALKPKTFTYKKDYYSNPQRQFLGLIAEDVAEVSTYLADFENEDGTGQVENVRYANIVVPLIKAVQELEARIKQLELK